MRHGCLPTAQRQAHVNPDNNAEFIAEASVNIHHKVVWTDYEHALLYLCVGEIAVVVIIMVISTDRFRYRKY